MRCFVHLVNGAEIIPNDPGLEASDVVTSEEMALQAIEDIRNEGLELGGSWRGWRLDIVDASGHILLSTVRFITAGQ
ncbi:hypothetical protein HPT29_026380 (plasmid) [Microvirga terrae]|uniref:DUF6894 domain-containing protein n=1 Tax=Microvirga terrae TaxID=2740529 RepID=A0ABY5RZE0_9HYPH|nr:hypothetical protein [Microvirga terrae]UVF22217.1 hypothetical protein HPT29_026380 [Microvirga terrae]